MKWSVVTRGGQPDYWYLTLRPFRVRPDGLDVGKGISITKHPDGYYVDRRGGACAWVGMRKTLKAAKRMGEIAAIEWELGGLDGH